MNTTSRKKVIIDCDPGIDDSLALMLALNSPELEILGITTVAGNVPAELGAQNALKVLQHCDRLDIPVYCGATTPLKRSYISAQDTHGNDGLGNSALKEAPISYQLDAVTFISKTLTQNSDVTIIALGPLTNIALVLKQTPQVFNNCSRFISMGGSFKSHGNCSPVAEYNCWCDPDASAYCFEKLPLTLEMVGLDVTREFLFTPNILEFISQTAPKQAEFIQKITRFYFDFHWRQEQVIGCVLNDPLAVIYTLFPQLFNGFEATTKIATSGVALGQSIVDQMDFWQAKHNSFILTDVNALKAMEIFLCRTCKLDKQLVSQVLPQITNLVGERHV